ncbi:hypothetical protein BG000_004103 [Podila horticola]|nr:hypothetical protein BG000_004103 [Podila horticola]
MNTTGLSISEIIFSVLKVSYQADDCRFVAARYKAIDELVLRNGRPFYMEMVNPKMSFLSCERPIELETQINDTQLDKVQVQSLVSVKPTDIRTIHTSNGTMTDATLHTAGPHNPSHKQ